jgi:hypothetical protein
MLSESLDLQRETKWEDVLKRGSRLFVDLAVATFVIRTIYYRRYHRPDYVFTFYVFNFITFALCLLMRKVPAELGFALALFAVFGILRYRTQQIEIRDLTFLFIAIGIGILNAVPNTRVSVPELFIVNATIVLMTWWLAGRARQSTRAILYDNLELLLPANAAALREDLKKRTGLDVERVEVGRVDFLRDSAELHVSFREVGPTVLRAPVPPPRHKFSHKTPAASRPTQ